MNKDIKLRLLLVPLILMVLIFVPVIIWENVPYYAYIWEMPYLIRFLFLLMDHISMAIWGFIFIHIPISVYIVILVVYTVVSWTWILRQKKGDAMYFIVWFVFCVLSILMYWNWDDAYYIMFYG